MFDPEFYPTPPALVRKMLEPFASHELANATILEPSAGSGAILDQIASRASYGHKTAKLYCCEQHPELSEILKGKGYRLVSTDFLAFQPQHAFNLIVMNPPFSKGADHVLHAWEILDSGHLVALVNAETVRNPHTSNRKLLAGIIQQFGTVEYLDSPFADADRTTKVDVALIRLRKPDNGSRFTFTGMKSEARASQNDEEVFENQVARQDLVASIEHSVKLAKQAAAELVKAFHALLYYGSTVDATYNRSIFEIIGNRNNQASQYNDLVDLLNGKAWDTVFSRSKIANLLTGKMREDFTKFSQTQGSMEFTTANVEALFSMLMLNKGSIMKQALDDVFESMCRYDKANKVHWEGWKTNSAYKVNRKVIIPHLFGYSSSSYSIPWSTKQFLNDVDKVMCWLTAEQFDAKAPDTISNTIGEIGMMGTGARFGEKLESRFFYLRYYMKGTLHFEWKNKDLWQRFNLAAAEHKMWLPA